MNKQDTIYQNAKQNLMFKFIYTDDHDLCRSEISYNFDEELAVSVCDYEYGECPQKFMVVNEYPRILIRNNERDYKMIEFLKRFDLYCEMHSCAKLRFQSRTECPFCIIDESL